MTPEAIVFISVLLRSVAAAWAIVVAIRLRDWRILFLTAMLVLLAIQQGLILVHGLHSSTMVVVEMPALAVSIMSLIAVAAVDRMAVRYAITASRLEDSQQRYESLVEDQTDLVCQFEQDGTLTFVNRSYAEYFGRSVDDLIGTNFIDLIPESERPAIRDYLASFGPTKTTSSITHKALLPSGETRWHEWMDRAFLNERGEVIGLQSVGRDITERKSTEDALRHSEELNRRIIEAFPGGIINVDRRGQVVSANEEGQRMLGVKEKQLTSVNIINLEPWTIYENGVTCPTDEFPATRCLRSGDVQLPVILGTLRPSGEISWAVFTAVPVRDPETNELEGAVVSFLDITDRKVSEEALRDSEANQRAMITALPDTVVRMTKDGIFREIIPAGEVNVFGGPVELLGRSVKDVMPPGVAARSLRAIRDALRTSELQQFQYEVEVDGEKRYLESRVVPDRTESVLCLVRDITERLVAELQREEVLVELEAKNRELERFARTVSHDLKSPLITIRGFMEVLEDDRANVSVRAQQAIDRINNAARMMLHLLDDLLELARVGRLVNPPEEVAFGEVVRSAVDQVAGRIVKRGVKVRIASDMPDVHADRTRLVQVMQNLVDNAVKFMGEQPHPQIEIGAETRGNDVLCFVRDNGSGIDPRNVDRVFGVFDRLHRDIEGTGIGLALAKRIIEVHGGRMWAESEGRGRGSCFYFTLPTMPASPRASNPAA